MRERNSAPWTARLAGVFLLAPLASVASVPPGTDRPQAGGGGGLLPSPSAELEYPPVDAGAHVDRYHGIEVADPYRALEDTTSEPTRRWARAQDALTQRVLASLPSLPDLRRRLAELERVPRFAAPVFAGGRYFVGRRGPGERQWLLHVQDGLDGVPRPLVDPGVFGDDATLAGFAPSPDGARVAYGISHAGSSWSTWRVRDVATGRDSAERLEGLRSGTLVWTGDSTMSRRS